jgi:hypothetical protein
LSPLRGPLSSLKRSYIHRGECYTAVEVLASWGCVTRGCMNKNVRSRARQREGRVRDAANDDRFARARPENLSAATVRGALIVLLVIAVAARVGHILAQSSGHEPQVGAALFEPSQCPFWASGRSTREFRMETPCLR